MLRLLVFISFFLFENFSFAQNWQLIWEDNFDGTELDSTKWMQEYGTGAQYGMWGWGNGELQHYQSQNTTLNNGIATIKVKEESSGIVETYWNTTSYYSSSKISTKGIFDFRYGKVEARMKTIDGLGFWPAFWMLPTGGDWPCDGEIDIMEHGLGATNHVSSALHTPSSSSATINTLGIDISDVSANYHIYSMNWSPNQITFLVDNVGFYTYNPSEKNDSTWPFYEEQFILLNVAMGGISGNIDAGFTQSSMIVDYVRVYQEAPLSVDKGLDLNSTLKLYPNPATDIIQISSKLPISRLALYNVFGKLILKKETDTNSLDVSQLNTGVYFLEAYSNTEKVVKKVIVN